MPRTVPFEAFEQAADAVIITDAEGVVRLCNPHARALLGRAGRSTVGEPCWRVMRLQRADGTPFCGPECPVRRRAKRGRAPTLQRLRLLGHDDRPAMEIDLFTITWPADPGGPPGIVHLIAPVAPDTVVPRGSREANVDDCAGIEALTAREREILERLSSGCSTARIARELFISPTTVRNHVRNLLGKLGLHRRVEAVLLWLRENGRSG